jgi:O-methyltransferase involved in polyketide biosynthesis
MLRGLADRAAPGSVLAASISTRETGAESLEARKERQAREERLAASGEAVLTVPRRATALTWLSDTGWVVPANAVQDSEDGRLLVRAVR